MRRLILFIDPAGIPTRRRPPDESLAGNPRALFFADSPDQLARPDALARM
tara:strand:+ start:1132 stop:1281 length:150 start_codon:yes stop_codon:yes gene_type:complete